MALIKKFQFDESLDNAIDPTTNLLEYSFSQLKGGVYFQCRTRGSENSRAKNPKQKLQFDLEEFKKILKSYSE